MKGILPKNANKFVKPRRVKSAADKKYEAQIRIGIMHPTKGYRKNGSIYRG